jgi:hypothetical protein
MLSSDFTFVARTKQNSRVPGKKKGKGLLLLVSLVFLRPCRRHGIFFNFFRPFPSVVMYGAFQWPTKNSWELLVRW